MSDAAKVVIAYCIAVAVIAMAQCTAVIAMKRQVAQAPAASATGR